jgi:hypothetical protein
MRRAVVGSLYVVTAVITGYWALRLMFLPLSGGPQSWWPPIMLGASILLLGGGMHVVVPQVRGVWLVLFAAVLPLALCAVLFGALAFRCGFFALVVALSMWITQALASPVNRVGGLALIVSLILAVSWVPGSVNTLRLYFSPTTSSPDPTVLILLLVPWVFIIASVIAGIALCRSPKSDASGSGGGFWHRNEHVGGAQ